MSTVVAVYDANTPEARTYRGQAYVHEFLEAHGINWMLCHRFEILANGDGVLRAYLYDGQPQEVLLRRPVPEQMRHCCST